MHIPDMGLPGRNSKCLATRQSGCKMLELSSSTSHNKNVLVDFIDFSSNCTASNFSNDWTESALDITTKAVC